MRQETLSAPWRGTQTLCKIFPLTTLANSWPPVLLIWPLSYGISRALSASELCMVRYKGIDLAVCEAKRFIFIYLYFFQSRKSADVEGVIDQSIFQKKKGGCSLILWVLCKKGIHTLFMEWNSILNLLCMIVWEASHNDTEIKWQRDFSFKY